MAILRNRSAQFKLIPLGIVAVYAVVVVLYAIKTPAWQIPDEPAHYNYVSQVVQTGALPVLKMGDWNNDYLNAI